MPIKFLNDVAVDTNVLYVDTSSDRVGIGTTSPDVALDVDASTGIKVQNASDVVFEANPTNGTFSLGDSGGIGGGAYIAGNDTDIDFFGDGDVRFQNNGNVGIATTSPSQKLDVNGNVTANRYYGTGSTTYYVDPNDTSQAAYFAGDIRITDSGTATIKLDSTSSQNASGSILVTKNGSTSPPMGGISWVENPGFQGSTWSQRLTNSPYTESSIKLPTSSSYNFAIKTLGSDRMVINSSGNVGIGTTDPESKLQIQDDTTSCFVRVRAGATSIAGIEFGDSDDIDIAGIRYSNFSDNMRFNVNGSERVRIDSSGNVGIGTTSPQAKLEVGDCESSGNIGDGNIAVKTNTNNTAIVIQEASGAEQWGLGVNSDGDFVLTDSGTERVRIDDNTGNFGIGTTAPAEKLVVSGSDDVSVRINSTKNGTWTTGQVLGAYEFYGNDASGAGAQIKGKIDCASLNQFGAGFHMRFFTAPGGVGTVAEERMRIQSSGAVTIGKTTPSSYNTQGIDLSPSGIGAFTRSGNLPLLVNRTGSDGTVVSIRNDNSQVGSISFSGSTTSFNTSSDYRLKENIIDLPNALDKIEQLKPKRFNFISEETTIDGFIAHEVQDVIPQAVFGEKDAVDEEGNPEYQGIDNSKIVPLLVGAIKELKAEIENLKLQIN